MPTEIIAGKNEAIPQGLSFSFDPRAGYKPGPTLKGPTGAMLARSTALAAAGIPYSFEESGGASEIRIQGGGTVDPSQTEAPIDSWQLLGNELQKDIFEHPTSLMIEASKTGSLGAIRNDVNAYNQALPLPTAFTYFPAVQSNVNALVGLLLRGTTHYPLGQPVLKHTQTVSDRYTGTDISYANAEKIYTTAKLKIECANFPYPLPATLIAAINSLPTPSATGYLLGWRKLPPTYITTANYMVEISTEYVWDLWSTYIYTAA